MVPTSMVVTTEGPWRGAILLGWTLKRLKWAITFQRGHDLPAEDRQPGQVPVVAGGGIIGWHDVAQARGPGIVTGRYGTIGEFHLVEQDYWPLNTCLYSIDLHGNHAGFLRYMLEPLAPLFHLNAAKSAVPGVDRSDIHTIPVAVPPLPSQRAIADYLDCETARIDALIAAKARVLALLAEKRRALITRAVTRGLDPHVQLKETSCEWLPLAPVHWTPTRVGRLFRQVKRQGFPDEIVLSVYRDYGVIERSSRNDNANRVPEDLEKYQLVTPHDLVINKMKAWQGSLGISPLRGITSPDYVVYTPEHSEDPLFLHLLLRNVLLTTAYLSMSNGIRTNQWRLEPERFETLQLFLPPVTEQREIVSSVSRQTAHLDEASVATERTIALLRERRAALIAAAVTGRISVEAAA